MSAVEIPLTDTGLTGLELVEERLANALASVAALNDAIDQLPGDPVIQFELGAPAYGARQRLLAIADLLRMQTGLSELPAGITIILTDPSMTGDEVK